MYVFPHTNKCWQRTYPCIYLQTTFISNCREVIVIQNSKNPKRQHFFLFFISVSLWSCLLWIILLLLSPMIQQSIQTVFQQQYRGKNEKWTLMKLLSWMSLSALYWSHSTCCWFWWKEIFSLRLYWYTLNEIMLQEKNWLKQWDSQTLWSQPGFTMLGQSPVPIGTELKCRRTRKIKNHKLPLEDFNILSISVCWYTPLLNWINLLLFSFSRVLNETLN